MLFTWYLDLVGHCWDKIRIKIKQTRKHSSRDTAGGGLVPWWVVTKTAFQGDAYHPFGNCPCFSFSCHHQMSLPGGSRSPNEKVWVGSHWPPLDFTSRGYVWCWEIGPQVWCPGGRGEKGVHCHVTYPMMYLMLPLPPWTGIHLWKYYFPQTLFASGNDTNLINCGNSRDRLRKIIFSLATDNCHPQGVSLTEVCVHDNKTFQQQNVTTSRIWTYNLHWANQTLLVCLRP